MHSILEWRSIMALTTGGAPAAFLPAETGPLIIRPVQRLSVAAQAATTIATNAPVFRVPVVAADPSASWTAESQEIAPSDATLAELNVPLRKLAALSIVSNELLADASPEVTQIVGEGIARDIAVRIDQAFFGATTANGPSGIRSLTTSTVSAGGEWGNLDAFAEATYTAEANGATLTCWTANPADALALSKIKSADGSNASLLDADPTQPARRLLAGLPLLVSNSVQVGTVYGIPQDRVMLVIRNNVDIQVDKSAFFTSDRSAIRATMRVGIAWPHPLAIVSITKA